MLIGSAHGPRAHGSQSHPGAGAKKGERTPVRGRRGRVLQLSSAGVFFRRSARYAPSFSTRKPAERLRLGIAGAGRIRNGFSNRHEPRRVP
jgi:hypothetical protein